MKLEPDPDIVNTKRKVNNNADPVSKSEAPSGRILSNWEVEEKAVEKAGKKKAKRIHKKTTLAGLGTQLVELQAQIKATQSSQQPGLQYTQPPFSQQRYIVPASSQQPGPQYTQPPFSQQRYIMPASSQQLGPQCAMPPLAPQQYIIPDSSQQPECQSVMPQIMPPTRGGLQ